MRSIPDDALTVDLAGEEVVLLPERALWWAARRTVLVADVHLGKAAAFRAAAVPIPSGTTRDDLARLSAVIERTRAERLVVLGDLYHATAGRTPDVEERFATWRRHHRASELLLVRGNHDLRAGDPAAELGATVVDGPHRLGPFVLRHDPEPSADGYVLAGHVHPAVRLVGPAGERMRMACFHFAAGVGVLPAFGSFTGSHRVRPASGDRVFVCAPGRVLAVPASAR